MKNSFFDGRLDGKAYLKNVILAILPFILLFLVFWIGEIIALILGIDFLKQALTSLLPIFGLVAFIFFAVKFFQSSVKRHRDLGQSWLIPLTITVILFIASIINQFLSGLLGIGYVLTLTLLRGEADENRYGGKITQSSFDKTTSLGVGTSVHPHN